MVIRRTTKRKVTKVGRGMVQIGRNKYITLAQSKRNYEAETGRKFPKRRR